MKAFSIAMTVSINLLAAVFLVLLASLLIGCGEVETAKLEQATYEKKSDVKPADQVWLRLPLACDQWIAKCGAGQKCEPRYTCAADLTRSKK